MLAVRSSRSLNRTGTPMAVPTSRYSYRVADSKIRSAECSQGDRAYPRRERRGIAPAPRITTRGSSVCITGSLEAPQPECLCRATRRIKRGVESLESYTPDTQTVARSGDHELRISLTSAQLQSRTFPHRLIGCRPWSVQSPSVRRYRVRNSLTRTTLVVATHVDRRRRVHRRSH